MRSNRILGNPGCRRNLFDGFARGDLARRSCLGRREIEKRLQQRRRRARTRHDRGDEDDRQCPGEDIKSAAAQRHDVGDKGRFCPGGPDRNRPAQSSCGTGGVRNGFHQQRLRRFGRELNRVASADADTGFAGQKARIRRDNAAGRRQRRSRQADGFEGRDGGFGAIKPQSRRKNRRARQMRPQIVQLLRHRARNRALLVRLLDREHQRIAGRSADRRADAPA
jgi:hypothetical protein